MSATTVEFFTCTVCGHRFEAADLPTECPKYRVHGSARTFPSDKILVTARQNDRFRAGMVVGGCPLPGTVVVTSGVRDRGRDFVTSAILAAAFDTAFSEDNDPWGNRPCEVSLGTDRTVPVSSETYSRARMLRGCLSFRGRRGGSLRGPRRPAHSR